MSQPWIVSGGLHVRDGAVHLLCGRCGVVLVGPVEHVDQYAVHGDRYEIDGVEHVCIEPFQDGQKLLIVVDSDEFAAMTVSVPQEKQ